MDPSGPGDWPSVRVDRLRRTCRRSTWVHRKARMTARRVTWSSGNSPLRNCCSGRRGQRRVAGGETDIGRAAVETYGGHCERPAWPGVPTMASAGTTTPSK
jgi:hypothetical protein